MHIDKDRKGKKTIFAMLSAALKKKRCLCGSGIAIFCYISSNILATSHFCFYLYTLHAILTILLTLCGETGEIDAMVSTSAQHFISMNEWVFVHFRNHWSLTSMCYFIWDFTLNIPSMHHLHHSADQMCSNIEGLGGKARLQLIVLYMRDAV